MTIVVWWARPLVCMACAKVTYRPPRTVMECSWCGGTLEEKHGDE